MIELFLIVTTSKNIRVHSSREGNLIDLRLQIMYMFFNFKFLKWLKLYSHTRQAL